MRLVLVLLALVGFVGLPVACPYSYVIPMGDDILGEIEESDGTETGNVKEIEQYLSLFFRKKAYPELETDTRRQGIALGSPETETEEKPENDEEVVNKFDETDQMVRNAFGLSISEPEFEWNDEEESILKEIYKMLTNAFGMPEPEAVPEAVSEPEDEEEDEIDQMIRNTFGHTASEPEEKEEEDRMLWNVFAIPEPKAEAKAESEPEEETKKIQRSSDPKTEQEEEEYSIFRITFGITIPKPEPQSEDEEEDKIDQMIRNAFGHTASEPEGKENEDRMLWKIFGIPKAEPKPEPQPEAELEPGSPEVAASSEENVFDLDNSPDDRFYYKVAGGSNNDDEVTFNGLNEPEKEVENHYSVYI